MAARLSVAGRLAFLAALGLSFLAFMGGLVFVDTLIFTIGCVALVGLTLAWELGVAAIQVVEGDNPRQRRLRRVLGVLELCAIVTCLAVSWRLSGGWDVFVTLPEQILLGLLWVGSSTLTVIAFRELRRHHGISEPAAEPQPPEIPPEVSDRFWAERRMRQRWWLLKLYACLALFASILAGMIIGEDDPTAAVLITFGMMIPLGFALVGLHKRWDVPLMAALPPRRLPDESELPTLVSFRPRLNAVLTMLVVPVTVVVAALAGVAELRGGPEPSISHGAATAIVAICGLVLVGVRVAGVRASRMSFEVGPEGMRIVNFWNTHEIPWTSTAAVDAAPSLILNAFSMAAATTGQEVPLSVRHGICVRLKDGLDDPAPARRIRSTVTVDQDPERSTAYGALVVALRRDAKVHGVPTTL